MGLITQNNTLLIVILTLMHFFFVSKISCNYDFCERFRIGILIAHNELQHVYNPHKRNYLFFSFYFVCVWSLEFLVSKRGRRRVERKKQTWKITNWIQYSIVAQINLKCFVCDIFFFWFSTQNLRRQLKECRMSPRVFHLSWWLQTSLRIITLRLIQWLKIVRQLIEKFFDWFLEFFFLALS